MFRQLLSAVSGTVERTPLPGFARRAVSEVTDVGASLAAAAWSGGGETDQKGTSHTRRHLHRDVVQLGASVVGVGGATAIRVAQAAPLPPTVPALVSHADFTPQVREEVEKRLGHPAADTVFTLGSTLAQTLAGQPVGLIVDALQRLSTFTEARAQTQAWESWEHELGSAPDGGPDTRTDVPPRPCPLPAGPVESYTRLAGPAAAGGYAARLLATRNHQQALGLLMSGTPKAPRASREAFAAQLGRTLAQRGAVAVDPEALRRLDRVDTLVLDSSVLLTGAHTLDEVIPVGGENGSADALEELYLRAHELVDSVKPARRHERDGWAVQPLADLDGGALSRESRERARERARGGGQVLALTRRGEPVGLVTVVPELAPLAEPLVSAAGEAGTVVVAGARHRLDQRLRIDRVVAGGPRLASSVRALQEEDRGVALVCARGTAALEAADVGIGVVTRAAGTPWGADLLTGPGLDEAHLLASAVPLARRTSKRGTQLALAATAAGSILAITGPTAGAPHRAQLPVNGAVLVGLADGTWSGRTLARRPPPVPVDRTPWSAMPASTVLERLESSTAGLSEEEAGSRLAAGDKTEQPEARGLFRASLDELANPLTPALAAGAGISASVGGLMDAAMIGGVIGINAVVGGAQRLGADRALARLVDATATRVRLRRSGAEVEATADRLVPGDVVELRAGDAVPADCRVIDASGLEVDESSLTGESQLVAKSADPTAAEALAERSSMLYEGTAIAAGRGLAVVVAAGAETEIGRTTRLAAGGTSTDGVEARLRSLTKVTMPVSLGAGLLLLGVNLARGQPVGQAADPAVGLAVASVPEGLPFVATVAELAAARRLSQRGALLRNPGTVEALGRVDVLCFDKTGTLTEGRIRLGRISDGHTDAPVDDLPPDLRPVAAAALRASPQREEGQRMAHPTDHAVVKGARKLDIAPPEDLGTWERIDELQFEPERGYHAVLGQAPGGQLLTVKGAPEVVLSRCSNWRRKDGSETPFTDDLGQHVEQEVERLARLGYRVLIVAERSASDRRDLDESRIRGLTLLGMVCLADPVRPAAKASVDTLRRAGAEVVMITGDHPSTSESIAAELGALNGGRVMTGPDLGRLDDEQLLDALPSVAVFARVTPGQKARIVDGLRRSGRAVAVTGDGANDAPAIRLADVGIALGSRATAAAREAADLVLTDDRIETITDAIVEGRAMWASVRDALAILLGGNVGEIAFTVASTSVGGADVLGTRQLLLVNLLTDMFPSMAVAVRPPPGVTSDTLLAEGPQASLGGALTRDIYGRAGVTAAAAMAAWLLARPVGSPARASTVALVALVAAQLGQTAVIGGRSPMVFAANVGSLAALGLVIQVPGVSQFFGCTPLGPVGWTISLTTAAAATSGGVLVPRLVRAAGRSATPGAQVEAPPAQARDGEGSREAAQPQRA